MYGNLSSSKVCASNGNRPKQACILLHTITECMAVGAQKLMKRRSADLSMSSRAELADLMLEQQFFLMLEAEIMAVNR